MASFSSRTDWAFLALLAVIVCAPFQRVDPLLVLPGQNLTNLEILAGIALGAWLLTHWIKGSWSEICVPLPLSGGMLILFFLVSAALVAPHQAIAGWALRRSSSCCSTQFWQWFFSLFWVQAIFGLRLRAPDDRLWCRAEYGVPSELRLEAGSLHEVEVSIENQGMVTWTREPANPIRFSYHWLARNTDEMIIFEGTRTDQQGEVAPS